MLLTSLHTKVAKVNGSKPELPMLAKLLATSAATPVKRHGCQLMQERATSKDAKIVIVIFTLSIFGKTPTKPIKRIKPLTIMVSLICPTYVKPASRESVSSDP